MPDRHDHNDDRHEQPYRPHLVCRAFVGDSGARPLAPDVIFYESPDIWVVAPDGSDIPAVGVQNQVNVRFWNLGLAPSYGTVVDLFWCNPSVGVNLASATPIGTKSTTIQPGAQKTLSFPWTPVFVNNGHECLVAHVYDPVSDNIVAPFNPVEDRHVAQKNLNLVAVEAGHQFDVHFFAANLTTRTQVSTLELQPLTGEALRELAVAHRLGPVRQMEGADAEITSISSVPLASRLNLDRHPVAAVFREALSGVPQAYSRQLKQSALWALPSAESLTHQQQQRTAPLTLKGIASRTTHLSRVVEIPPRTEFQFTLALRVPLTAKPGSYAAFRVVEHSESQITGGVTFVVRTTK